MVQVRGTVHDVSDNPERVEHIVVRAVEPRMHGTTYITEESVQFPVVDGVLDFDVLPGPCVVAFLRPHGATTYEKLLVPDVEEATFSECLDAAALAEEGTRSALEKVVRQIQEELSKVAPLVNEVRTLHTEVSDDRTAVDGFAKAAQKSASDAATSQSKAKTSETNAANSAASAKSQQESAKTHFNNTVAEAGKAADSAAAAKTSETNAASSESKAATHETNAGASATAAASSADEAAGHADRAELATDVTGLRNVLTQQIAELVDGAPEDLNTIREVAEYAQENRGVTDQLNAAIGNKADKVHTHTWESITGRPDVPVTDAGYRIREAEDSPLAFPAGVSVSMSSGDQGWTDALKASDPDYQYSGFVVILTIRNGNYTQSTYQMVYSYTSVTRPIYIRKYNGSEDGWSTFRKLSDDGHKHAISDVTGLQTELDSKPTHNTMKSGLNDKANKSHTHAQSDITGLSTALNNKAAKTHSHTTADITDFSTEMGKKADTTDASGQTVARYESGSSQWLKVGDNPTWGGDYMNSGAINLRSADSRYASKTHTHTTSQISGLGTALDEKADKSYVDDKAQEVKDRVYGRPAIFNVPNVNVPMPAESRVGDILITTDTWSFYVLAPAK